MTLEELRQEKLQAAAAYTYEEFKPEPALCMTCAAAPPCTRHLLVCRGCCPSCREVRRSEPDWRTVRRLTSKFLFAGGLGCAAYSWWLSPNPQLATPESQVWYAVALACVVLFTFTLTANWWKVGAKE